MGAGTRFCRSSGRRQRCSRGRSLRDCPTLPPRSLWSALLAFSLLLLSASAVRGSGGAMAPFPMLAVLALAVACGPVTSDLALGQIALLALAAATLVVLVAARSLPFSVAAACLAFAQPNVSLGLASQLGRNRATLAIALGAGGTYALGALAAGWAWPLEYARILGAHGAAERFAAIQFSPASIAFGFGATPLGARFAGVVATLLAIAAAIAIASRVRDGFARFAAFSALAPFAAGFFHEHDLVVAFVAASWCALRTRATVRIIALAGTLLVCVDWLGLAQRPTGITQSALLALAALSAFTAAGREPELRGPAGGGICVRRALRRRRVACHSESRADLAGRAWSLSCSGPRADCGAVGGRATGKRIACGNPRVGAATLAIAAGVRAA